MGWSGSHALSISLQVHIALTIIASAHAGRERICGRRLNQSRIMLEETGATRSINESLSGKVHEIYKALAIRRIMRRIIAR